MFESLTALPPDPILGLMEAYRQDLNSHKIDLGVGVYRDENGDTPILSSVQKAQQHHVATELTKSYIAPSGSTAFNKATRELIFGLNHDVLKDGRVATVQTPGGCGALRVGAELIKRARQNAILWVSDPTWANHVPLLGSAGLQIQSYRYYDPDTRALNADAMIDDLQKTSAGDVVLIHGCCHNPSGVDLRPEHWGAVANLANERGFIPFVDLAYQGLGDGLDRDAHGARLLGRECEEFLVASSCSKNFGLYRERVGTLQIASSSLAQTSIIQSQIEAVARGIYSMPPSHGAAIVETILEDEALRASWVGELDHMRDRLNRLRELISIELSERTNRNFGFIREQRGMFSFLGITPEQIERLRDDFSIYLVGSSRINIAGINDGNLAYFIESVSQVLRD